jgi:tetrapyrrole methylase family protein/MazG family protein
MNTRPEIAQRFVELVDIMARLRSHDGCPWDRKQTHESLKRFLVEEAHELFDEIDAQNPAGVCGELGDLFLQLVFHAQVASEAGQFDVGDALGHINRKLRHRHPHVFGQEHAATPEDVLAVWHRQKAQEGQKADTSILAKAPKSLPALARAQSMTRECSKVGFDWDEAKGALEKVFEELQELRSAIGKDSSHEEREAEFGDLFFALVNVCRFMGIEAEEALRKANAKFERRFRKLEAQVAASGRNLADMTLREMDDIWDRIKEDET